MRELKFRAWDSEWNLMDYQFYISSEGEALDRSSITYDTPNIEIEPAIHLIVMQFTGLKDKNGVDIYEGDIVYLAGYGKYEVTFPFIELYEAAMEGDIGDILGNIYENKDFLDSTN